MVIDRYFRIDIEDQERFLETEIDSEEAARGSDYSSDAGEDREDGGDRPRQTDGSSRSSSGSSSRKSSFFSGEVSEDIHGCVARESANRLPNYKEIPCGAGGDASDLNLSNVVSERSVSKTKSFVFFNLQGCPVDVD